jgi:hypothetical protein
MRTILKTKNLFYQGKLACRFCGKTYRHLGSHLYHGHKVLAREYKEMFELPFREALIDQGIYEKKKAAFEKGREKYIKNLTKAGKKYQFKKGQTGQRRISQSEKGRIIRRIKGINKKRAVLKPCPVCRMKFNNVESHLYQKHRLICVK